MTGSEGVALHFSRACYRGVGTLLILISLISGCSTGAREFELYRQSYALQFAEGERVVERLGTAERRLWREVAQSRDFNPNDAKYYVDVGDPPLATSVRASLVALRNYNDLLADLSSGAAGDRFASGASSVYSNLAQARTNLISAQSGPGPVVVAAAALNPFVSIALNTFAREASKFAFRQQLLAAYGPMSELLAKLRNITPQMFNIMRASEMDKFGRIADLKQVEADKKLLASWVILLDESQASMSAAYEAIRQGQSTVTLTGLNDASTELRVLSEQIRAERMK